MSFIRLLVAALTSLSISISTSISVASEPATQQEMAEEMMRLASRYVGPDIRRRAPAGSSTEYITGPVNSFLRITDCQFEFHWDDQSRAVMSWELGKYSVDSEPTQFDATTFVASFELDPRWLADHRRGGTLRHETEKTLEYHFKLNGDPSPSRAARIMMAPGVLDGMFGEHLRSNHYRSQEDGRIVYVGSVYEAVVKLRPEDAPAFIALAREYRQRFCMIE
ncbi:hypothetical protein H0I76_12795 [Limibaculum sp. M0105]|uniref:Uncharacterized protein n=1 Tax=Thermohalobaculum xanthum TaxID=2753746 RepID=A0A8J7SI21_9RHOB|nr:hypothetical protein [Thermohalobaculum xanthum]MBK0400070.1 hypothetical protein [Thermohalobaculum xanthum]